MRIQREQVVAEQSIYAAGLLPVSVARQPLDQLLPVRQSNAWLRDAEAELERPQRAIGLLPQFESTLVHTMARTLENTA